MPRRRVIAKRPVAADPVFNSQVVTKFVHRMMTRGKKSKASSVFYEALRVVEKRLKKEPLEVFIKALANVKPVVEVKSKRVGGANYQVPVEVNEARKEALGMRWIIQYARTRSGRSMSERLGAELIDAYNSTGSAFKKKDDTHRMAEANKAFSHYRW